MGSLNQDWDLAHAATGSLSLAHVYKRSIESNIRDCKRREGDRDREVFVEGLWLCESQKGSVCLRGGVVFRELVAPRGIPIRYRRFL